MKNVIYAEKCISCAMLPELVEHKRRSWQRGYERHPPSDVNQHRKTTHVPTCCIETETKTSRFVRHLSAFCCKSGLNVNWWEPWLIHKLVPRIVKAGSRRIFAYLVSNRCGLRAEAEEEPGFYFIFSEETWESAPALLLGFHSRALSRALEPLCARQKGSV